MKNLHIFKTGQHVAMNGKKIEFSETDLKATAAAYDPALHEAPLVIGHPTHDGPAYGWAKALNFQDSDLYAEPDQVDDAFAEMVAGGKFKKRSASFYPPDSPSNPVPGVYYLRHIGFLGAQPPAVKGLKPVEFADDEDGLVTIEFGDWTDQTIARMFRKLKNFLIEHFGKDEADKVIDEWEVEDITRESLRPDGPAEPVFSEPTSDKESGMTNEELEAKKAELEKREADFAERENEISAREKNLEKRDQEARDSELVAFCDDLVNQGKLLPAHKEPLLAALKKLPADVMVSFAENDKTVEKSPLDALKGVFSSMPNLLEFGEVVKPGDEFRKKVSADQYSGKQVDEERLALHNKVLAYAEAKGLSYEAALTAVNAN